jgi:hypothetical protein
MNNKERLVKLLADLRFLGGCERQIADHLIKNGVIFANDEQLKEYQRKLGQDNMNHLLYSKNQINNFIHDSGLKKVTMAGVHCDLEKLKPLIEDFYEKHIFYLSYWENDAPYFGWDLRSGDGRNMAEITDGITERFKEIYALILAGLGEEIAEGDKNAACDEKAASAEDLKRKMMEDATSYKIPCAHPIEQVQKTYCPQEGVYEYYCHNCGARWWVKKHE